MQEFLLIVISMLLGFWQGLKKRNKKNNIKIKEYERKLLEKESEIERLKHRIRLEQYNNGTLKKKNKDTTLLSNNPTLSSSNSWKRWQPTTVNTVHWLTMPTYSVIRRSICRASSSKSAGKMRWHWFMRMPLNISFRSWGIPTKVLRKFLWILNSPMCRFLHNM